MNRYRVDLPLVDLRTVVFEFEAEDECEAEEKAKRLWRDYCVEIINAAPIKNNMPVEIESGVVVTEYDDARGSWIGDSVYVDRLTSDEPVSATP